MDSELKKIKEISLARPDQEVCGFVVKNDGKISVIEAINEAQEPERFFEIGAKQYLNVILNNEEVVYVYHSHIEGSAEPSDFDKVMVEHTGLDFLIYSIEDDEFQTFKLNG